MSFRGHFIVNVIGEVVWLVLLLVFIRVIYANTADIKGWSQPQYYCLIGSHMIVTSLFEALFFGNCWRIAQLVRSGDLDFVLVRPANTQFLLSLERIDYAALANAPVGLALCVVGLIDLNVSLGAVQVALFPLLIGAGVMILYSLLFMFAVTSVWFIRQTGVDHLWFYAVSLARYPAEIYRQFARGTLYFALVFVVPVLMVSNLPANVLVRSFNPCMVAYVVGSAVILLGLSTIVFRVALRSYRSASS